MSGRIKKLVLTLLAIGLILALFLLAWTYLSSSGPEVAGGEDLEEAEDLYQSTTLYEQDPITVKGLAQLQVDQSYTYDPELGEIETVHVADGQVVKKGDRLFTYRKTDQESLVEIDELKREQTKLYNQRQALQASLANAQNAWANYQKQVNIQEPLLASQDQEEEVGEEGVEPDLALDPPADDPASIKAAIQEVKLQIQDLEAKLAQAQNSLYQNVLAKADGTVYLDQRGRDDNRQAFIRLVGDQVYIRGSVNEFEFFALGDNRIVDLFVPAENKELKGKMVEYDRFPGSGQEGSQSSDEENLDSGMWAGDLGGDQASNFNFTVKPDDYIQPGFSVEMLIQVPGIAIPPEAIVLEGDDQYVFAYQENSQTVKKVKLESEPAGQAQVTKQADLKAGTQVILYPDGLEDGQSVSLDTGMEEGDLEGMEDHGEEAVGEEMGGW